MQLLCYLSLKFEKYYRAEWLRIQQQTEISITTADSEIIDTKSILHITGHAVSTKFCTMAVVIYKL